MIDILSANAEKTEQQSRLTAESLQAMRDAGGFALGSPPAATAAEVVRVLTGIGRVCPSSAWVAGTCLTAKVLATRGASYGPATLDELFADPDALFCGSGVPSGQGVRDAEGVRVTGRWANVSGCADAAMAGLAVTVDGTFSYAQIPTAELTVDHTWRMAGMRGTGSHTVVAEDVVVPAHRVSPLRLPADPRTMQLFALSVAAPVVGATLGALDVVTALFASDHKPSMSPYQRMGDSPGARQWLAEATSLVERAERAMHAVAEAVDGEAGITDRDGVELRRTLASAARDCRTAMDLLLDLHGASGFADSNPLQRFWRDAAVGGRHPQLRGYLLVDA